MSDMAVSRFVAGKKRQTTRAAKETQKRKVDRHVKVHQVPVAAMETARMLADGDMTRVKVQGDGSVVVVNG